METEVWTSKKSHSQNIISGPLAESLQFQKAIVLKTKLFCITNKVLPCTP